MKIVIVGAGIAGLATGWRLAQAGASVVIVERGRAGRGATWASAGMLAPGVELGCETGALADFARASRVAWPAFAKELETASGRDIGFRADGSLIVAGTEARAKELRERALRLQSANVETSWLSSGEMHAREPLLSSSLHGALFVASDAQVDNRALGEALPTVLARMNVALHENCEARAVAIRAGRAFGVVTSQDLVEGDAVVLATGAWLNLMDGVDAGVLPPVAPAKGQMIALAPPAGTALPKALIWDEDVYLVPRRHTIFAGATMEDSGFDISVTREAFDRLASAAARLIPEASKWQVSEIWAGLRPRSQDGAPVLGETSIAGLYVAGGQFRNGILFAPLVAEAMRRAVLEDAQGAIAVSFDPKRFRSL